MKRLVWMLVLFCLFFTGCGSSGAARDIQTGAEFRTSLMESGGCDFLAEITADYGERVYEFTLQCRYSTDSDAFLTVIAPETIAGISANVDADGAKVEFDGVELDYGTLANGRIAPMTLPWLMGKAWSSEYIESAGKDGDLTLVTYLMGYEDEELMIETWFGKDAIPQRCDVSHDGVRYLTVSISDFVLY